MALWPRGGIAAGGAIGLQVDAPVNRSSAAESWVTKDGRDKIHLHRGRN